MNKKMICLDIDGTIKDTEKGLIYPSTIETIKKLKENGHIIVIASGRNRAINDLIKEVIPYVDAYILTNGSQILYEGEEVYRCLMDKESLKPLFDDFDKHNITYSMISKDDSRISKVDEWVFDMYREWKIHEPKVDKDYIDKEDIYQCWCFGNKDVINEIRENNPSYAFMEWFNDSPGYDVVKKGVNKANAIIKLCDILDVSIKDTIAIGDSDNDINMLKTVGFGIAMGNANYNVKSHAKYVTDHIREDGFTKAFKYLNLI